MFLKTCPYIAKHYKGYQILYCPLNINSTGLSDPRAPYAMAASSPPPAPPPSMNSGGVSLSRVRPHDIALTRPTQT